METQRTPGRFCSRPARQVLPRQRPPDHTHRARGGHPLWHRLGRTGCVRDAARGKCHRARRRVQIARRGARKENAFLSFYHAVFFQIRNSCWILLPRQARDRHKANLTTYKRGALCRAATSICSTLTPPTSSLTRSGCQGEKTPLFGRFYTKNEHF